MTARLISRGQVAIMLGHTPDWFARHRKKLESKQGFPPRVPGCGARWDVDAIHEWLNSHHKPATKVTIVTNDNIERELVDRARAIAGELRGR